MGHQYYFLGFLLWPAIFLISSANICTTPDNNIYYIKEGTAVDSTVLTFDLEGFDTEFTLTYSGGGDFLTLDHHNVTLKKDISDQTLVLFLIVHCTPKDGQTVESRLTFMVDPVNHPPVFTKDTYHFTVPEDAKVGSTIFTHVSARDEDQGEDGEVFYRIAPSDDPVHDYLALASDRDPKIILIKQLDFEDEEQRMMSIKIIAENEQDDGEVGTTCDVVVEVTNVNDMDPAFRHDNCSASLPQSIGVGATVHISPPLVAEDQDAEKSDIRYTIQVGEEFQIDEVTAEVKVHSELTPGYHPIIVQAREKDNIHRSDWTLVDVHVIWTNNSEPRFEHSSYTAIVSEAQHEHTRLITVKGDDPQSNVDLTYSLPEPSDHFVLSGGGVMLAHSLDYEKATGHTFEVTLTDGEYVATSTVTITVTDVNDNSPVIKNGAHVKVTLKPKHNSTVHTIEASDADRDDTVSFHLMSHKELFEVGTEDGIVKFVGEAADVTKQEYVLIVEVHDSGHPTRRAFVEIVATFQRELAFEMANYTIHLPEYIPTGVPVYQVRASDGTHSSGIEYGILENQTRFVIDSESGFIYVHEALDYEASHHHLFHVTAKYGEHETHAKVEVLVVNENDNSPVVKHHYQEKHIVPSMGAKVVQIEATDADPHTVLSYHIARGASLFSVDAMGKLTISGDDFTEHEHIVQVLVRDDVVPYRETMVTVKVTFPANELKFNPATYHRTVSEAAHTGIVLVGLHVENGADVKYIFLEPVSMFHLDNDSGVIKLHEHLDYETKKQHTIHIMAVDGTANTTATVVIDVTDANDNDPHVDQQFVEVTAQREKGSVLHTIEATDADEGQTLSYHMANKEHFSVDEEGKVTITSEEQDMPNDQYHVVVKVMDNGTPPRATTVVIKVSFDTATYFPKTSHHVYVSEATATGTSLLTVEAEGESLTYSFEGEVTMFHLDSSSGEIKLHEALNYESETEHVLSISVTDNKNTAKATVTVHVLDANDNNPVVTNGVVIVKIFSERTQGQLVHTIQATDEDAGAVLSYVMVEGKEHFGVDSEGKITITASPDDLNEDTYHLLVKVHDGEQAPREASVAVNVVFESAEPAPTPAAVAQAGSNPTVVIAIMGVGLGVLLIAILCILVYSKKKRNRMKMSFDDENAKGLTNKPSLQSHTNFGYESMPDEEVKSTPKDISPKDVTKEVSPQEDIPLPAEDVLGNVETVELSDGETTVQVNPLADQVDNTPTNAVENPSNKEPMDVYQSDDKSEDVQVVEEIQVQSVYIANEIEPEMNHNDVDDSDDEADDIFPPIQKRIMRFKNPSEDRVTKFSDVGATF